jgi:hypothetical protein
MNHVKNVHNEIHRMTKVYIRMLETFRGLKSPESRTLYYIINDWFNIGVFFELSVITQLSQ